MNVYLVSLGCAKNQVDSERLISVLRRAGHEIVEDPREADTALVNTCGFIRPAVEESVDVILELEDLKNRGVVERIGVLGCLLNRYREQLRDEFPAVDFWAEAEKWDSLLQQMGGDSVGDGRRELLPGSSPWSRYLKIAEGCNNRCTYCTIPFIRGPLRSTPVPELVSEARALAAEGAMEICLIAQDPTAYGMDLSVQSQLIPLLDALEDALPPHVWLRLLYVHPRRVDERLLQRIASGRNLVPYLDVPVQHVDGDILSSMNRGTTEEHVRWIFRRAREINPDFALRTTLMTGFPGEDRDRFEKLLDFLEAAEPDRAGAFAFCPEEGTPAESMVGQVSEVEKDDRLTELLEFQESVSRSRQERFVGRDLRVLVEEEDPEKGVFYGRSYRDAPEIDGMVEIHGGKKELELGTFVTVRIGEALEHDLVGEVKHV